MPNYKYKPLDTNSDYSNDSDDVPLLKISDNTSNDSDSVLLNINDENDENNNKQIKFDIYSRNIIRFFLITIIMTAFTLTFTIIGGIDYFNTDSKQILYSSNGELLFRYYYIITICQYIIFLLFSIYLVLYIICCSGLCFPVRDIAFFNMLKINLGLFALNIIIKIMYVICLLLIINNDLDTPITKIPKYYNYIIIEIVIYFTMQIINICFVGAINNLIDFYYTK